MNKKSATFWVMLFALSARPAFGADGIFTLPKVGCPMAHCDSRMSDDDVLIGPLDADSVTILSQDSAAKGTSSGLGCSSNGVGGVVACSLGGPLASREGPNLIVYNADGTRRFDSGSYLDFTAFASAPIVSVDGSVVAADDKTLIRFNADGSVAWKTALPGGIPISPILVEGKYLVLATQGGPLSVYRLSDGHPLGTLALNSATGSDYYDTINTPCAFESRFYVSTNLHGDPSQGRLFAIDIVGQGETVSLEPEWNFDFGGPSGASPLCVKTEDSSNDPAYFIYFDGSHLASGSSTGNPYLFGLRDLGTTHSVQWQVPVVSKIEASANEDPRGGLWYFTAGGPLIVRRDFWDGHVLQAVKLNSFFEAIGTYSPSSATSISLDASGRPVMTLGIGEFQSASGPIVAGWVASIDLGTGTLNWSVPLPSLTGSSSANWTASQFPIVMTAAGKPRVVFPTRTAGPYFVGSP